MILGSKVIFFGLFVGFVVIRGIFALIAHQSGLSTSFEIDNLTQKEQKISPKSIIVILFVLALIVFYAVWPENRNILIVPLPSWLKWPGITLGLISLGQQIWVHITLQNNWSVARKAGKNNIVITCGPFTWIRHPLYLALMLLLISFSLGSGFSLFFLLTILSILSFNSVAQKEEKEMTYQFGEEYKSYMKHTGRFFPRLQSGWRTKP